MSSKPYIPALNSFTGFITNVNEKAAFLLRHFIYNPTKVSDFFEDEQLSMRKAVSMYQDTPDILTSVIRLQLTTALTKYIPEMLIDVTVTHEDITDEKYKLIFNITGAPTTNEQRQPLILSGSFLVDEDHRISIKFNN